MSVEISAEHPLYLFDAGALAHLEPEAQAETVAARWETLPSELRPHAALLLQLDTRDAELRQSQFRVLLTACQTADIPVCIVIGDGARGLYHPLEQVEALLRAFTCVRGVSFTGLPFDVYEPAIGDPAFAAPPWMRWSQAAIETAARYGRFVWIPLDQLHWVRAMSNVSAAPFQETLREFHDYVLPGVWHRGPHTIAQTAALMGLWLEGSVANWGVQADSRWYAGANYLGPGRLGTAAEEAEPEIPSSIYRAMILNGAMTGAAVYAFTPARDLWFGPERRHWDAAIGPTLRELAEHGFIARKDFVRRKAPVAFQLAPASTPEDFHLNLRDIDAVLNAGLLQHGAYGVARPGVFPELVLNRGANYWIPILSAFAGESAAAVFSEVIRPGVLPSVSAWRDLLARHARPDGEGRAFITEIGRAIFIMNTSENLRALQDFRIPAAPAPVRGLVARREGNAVELTWPFREGDLSYRVLRRVPPERVFTVLANGLDARRFVDASPPADETAIYAVTALTSEKEPYEGVVGHGDYRVLSVVESRVAEEAALTPLLGMAEARPVPPPDPGPEDGPDWWRATEALDGTAKPLAEIISERFADWQEAVSGRDLAALLDLYSDQYRDPQGWSFEYVRRAYQWYFERYSATRLAVQVRHWDFSLYESRGRVLARVYLRFTGWARTDSAGRVADVPVAWPRTGDGEIWVTFAEENRVWRLVHTDPAVPNFREILSFSAGPYDNFHLGPDIYTREEF